MSHFEVEELPIKPQEKQMMEAERQQLDEQKAAEAAEAADVAPPAPEEEKRAAVSQITASNAESVYYPMLQPLVDSVYASIGFPVMNEAEKTLLRVGMAQVEEKHDLKADMPPEGKVLLAIALPGIRGYAAKGIGRVRQSKYVKSDTTAAPPVIVAAADNSRETLAVNAQNRGLPVEPPASARSAQGA